MTRWSITISDGRKQIQHIVRADTREEAIALATRSTKGSVAETVKQLGAKE